jgi:hypothetical protein
MNRALNSLLVESLVSEATTPEKLILEHAMLIGLLHVDVGSEVGEHALPLIYMNVKMRNSPATEGEDLYRRLRI